ncbi:exodeoxyribonuclease VII large subunit [Xaviernesmea oryzae]|uniref:Exodeoxyribonuclease 7 large subunit n=1 Tax=Xaviernesmea oryzae TaxID=464029 RepID=A0A1Q9AUC3_9HYPH|nr:exodeoxyribonuclease VII large subunit [Xaviernesmea oryzae]OLP59050.1 exodeoxyribonuclease VII large subunit [Xaviernesmea oryzae]SEK89005.1 Exodeoxyribonuclease VII large subunit [Xaviernesmea oryzae]
MSLLFDSDAPSNLTEFSVSELSGAIKRTVEQAFDQVRVRGEISGYRGPHSSGHAYFTLKDDKARIDAVVWKGTMSRLRFKPEEGMDVIAVGRITTFPGSSKYQIVIETLEPAGAGALMALLEERRRKLAAEGLFDAERKRPLPFLPRVIGVVTSPTGAVIRDIFHRIADRYPLHVLVWPVRVQGEGSGEEVARAIAGFNALEPDGAMPRPDVLIVARGGGSLEDLWGFNDEAVVRAAAASQIPLISAVGHETDWTLIDHAADRRAPTPTGAAEMAVPVKAELDSQIAGLGARLQAAVRRQMDNRRQAARALARALPSLDQLLALPRRRFDEASAGLGRALQMNTAAKRRSFERVGAHLRPELVTTRLRDRRRHLDERFALAERLTERMTERAGRRLSAADVALRGFPARALGQIRHGKDRVATLSAKGERAVIADLKRFRERIEAQNRMLQSLSYVNVLARGYVLVRDEAGVPLKTVAETGPGRAVTLQFSDGRIAAVTGEDVSVLPPVEPAAAARPARSRKRRSEDEETPQGSLF